MNPTYGPPYLPQHYSHQPAPNTAPPPPPYYPVQYHHPHPYTPYQYPPVVMYPSQRPPPTTDPTPPPPAAASKRKRKSTDRSDDDTVPSGSDLPRTPVPTASSSQQVDLKKRTKTQRACDSCRSRKIRCDVLPDTEPPVCQHCKQYGFECTFHLPITETRFKKKKQDEDSTDKESTRPVSPPKSDPQSSVFGGGLPPHLLRSHQTTSSRIYENDDPKYYQSFNVALSADGLVVVRNSSADERLQAHNSMPVLHVERVVIEQLVNSYFTEISPILPILTKADFIANPKPPPILLYSICLVAATRRHVPSPIFDSIRFTVNNLIKADDVLSTPTIVNVQSLLILCMTGDCHSQFVPDALSALWVRLGTAIRMAQDLDLHRAESSKQDIDLRRRLWAACLVCDRWTSLIYGHPYMIDVQDCDVRLPSSGDPADLYMEKLVRISVILGKVLKTIYGPSGLSFVTDEILYSILADIELWKSDLPHDLKIRGSDTPLTAGLLHLLYSCVCMMFWRVFMRISYSCPAHLKFGLTPDKWTPLVESTGEAIDWLDSHEHVYDVWLLIAYAAVSCALVQYHTWARRKDDTAVIKLRKLRDAVQRWESSVSPDRTSARRKSAEIISLLYQATQGPHFPLMTSSLEPKGGTGGQQPARLEYEKDPTRPSPGVFVARSQAKDLDQGDIATVEGSANVITEQERTAMVLTSSAFAPSLKIDVPTGARSHQMTPNHIGNGGTGSVTANQQGQVCTQPMPSIVNEIEQHLLNMNPAMNTRGEIPLDSFVQVMNVLDGPQTGNTLQEFALTDLGFLEGIPGGMFDWGQWDTFFSRFAVSAPESTEMNINVPSTT